jgi:arabinan endo-1,5-alpha-L-arabinosidase
VLSLLQRGEYLLFGTTSLQEQSGQVPGFDCYQSRDLEIWRGPIPVFRGEASFWGTQDFWAPEVHPWQGRWYLLASFKAPGRCRGTHALVADHPEGPYRAWAVDPLTPRDWECLDGTLHVEHGRPWLVFCHEWLQIRDGAMYAVALNDDLSAPLGPPVLLFRASQAPWTRENATGSARGSITDGPWLHRLADGTLLLLWSSFAADWQYGLTMARSRHGILGPWYHDQEPLIADDAGHGMLFRTFGGDLRLAAHRPNRHPLERAFFQPVVEGRHGISVRG